MKKAEADPTDGKTPLSAVLFYIGKYGPVLGREVGTLCCEASYVNRRSTNAVLYGAVACKLILKDTKGRWTLTDKGRLRAATE